MNWPDSSSLTSAVAPDGALTADGSSPSDDLVDRIVERCGDVDAFGSVWTRIDALKERTVDWRGQALTRDVLDRRERAGELLRLLATNVREARSSAGDTRRS